jgi:hypothetical protein
MFTVIIFLYYVFLSMECEGGGGGLGVDLSRPSFCDNGIFSHVSIPNTFKLWKTLVAYIDSKTQSSLLFDVLWKLEA